MIIEPVSDKTHDSPASWPLTKHVYYCIRSALMPTALFAYPVSIMKMLYAVLKWSGQYQLCFEGYKRIVHIKYCMQFWGGLVKVISYCLILLKGYRSIIHTNYCKSFWGGVASVIYVLRGIKVSFTPNFRLLTQLLKILEFSLCRLEFWISNFQLFL